MISLHRQTPLRSYKILDIVATILAFLFAAFVVSHQYASVAFSEFLSMRIKIQNFVIFLGVIIIWHSLFSTFGLYNSQRIKTRRTELWEVVKALSLATLIVSVAAVLFKIILVSPVFVVVFWGASIILVVSGRYLLRGFLLWLHSKEQNLRFLLIVGTGDKARRFARNIAGRPELGYKLIGFVSEKPHRDDSVIDGVHVLAGLEELPSLIRESVIDELVITLPADAFYREISDITSFCEDHGVVVRIMSDLFNLRFAKSRVDNLDGDPIITVFTGELEGWSTNLKRLMDIFFAALLLVLLSPLFLLTAILIKLTSTGPMLFVQERVGLNKRKFRMYKFRTMVPGAERLLPQLEHLNLVDGPAFKLKEDPRVTPLGKILRRTRIDELPQLINVLAGDMSLVGPRPLPLRDYSGFKADWQRRRFSVRPGITCLWQVSGQHEMPFEKWMELDMEYIDRWSLLLDCKILLRTIPALFRGT